MLRIRFKTVRKTEVFIRIEKGVRKREYNWEM
jgi:hypothetical protein